MIFTPDIFDFASAETFLKLQNKFRDYDERYPSYNQSNEMMGNGPCYKEITSKDFDIIYKETDQSGKESLHTVFFNKDFLTEIIPTISKHEILKIKKNLNAKFRYAMDERKQYLEELISEFIGLDNSVLTCDFLRDENKIEISAEIHKILEFIHSDKIWHNKKDERNKIKFKLIRAEVIGLFFFLDQKGLIQRESLSELGRLIEDNFMCYDEKTRSYKEITSAKSTLYGYKSGDKSLNTAATNLKNLLSDDEFYNLKDATK